MDMAVLLVDLLDSDLNIYPSILFIIYITVLGIPNLLLNVKLFIPSINNLHNVNVNVIFNGIRTYHFEYNCLIIITNIYIFILTFTIYLLLFYLFIINISIYELSKLIFIYYKFFLF
jgi:hypothetical protein